MKQVESSNIYKSGDLDAVEDVEDFIDNAMPYKYVDPIAYLAKD